MKEWIESTLSAPDLGLAVIPAVFLLGLLASATSGCSLPILGSVLGYAGTLDARSSRRKLLLVSLCFLLGTIFSLALLGAAGGLAGQAAGRTLGRYGKVSGGLLMVLFGLAGLGLAPVRIPKLRFRAGSLDRGLAGAGLYGLGVGAAATGCSVGCSPVLGLVLAASWLKGATFQGAGLLAVFGLGYGLPLAAALAGIGLGMERVHTAARRVLPVVQALAGAFLVGSGFHLLATIR